MSTLDGMPGPTSRHFISQRLRMHYVDWGNPDAPPLLLVHGGRDHCRNWDWVAQKLRRDWHIICPDLRGHGDSQWSPDGNYNMSAYVYDLAQLIHQQALAPVTIVSHSLGGNISLRYTGLFPETVRKLVVDVGRHIVVAVGRPLAVAVSPQVGTDDVPVAAQFLRDPIPIPTVISAAVNQKQRRRIGIAPIDIVHTQTLGDEVPGRRYGHAVEGTHGSYSTVFTVFMPWKNHGPRQVVDLLEDTKLRRAGKPPLNHR